MATGQATDGLEAVFAGEVRLLPIAPHADSRGMLVEFDFAEVPFTVRRAFTVTGVPAGTTRGGHRHRDAAQLLACLTGRIEVLLRRGEAKHELVLTPETGALYIAPGVWASQRYAVEGSTLLVFASEPFDPASYEASF